MSIVIPKTTRTITIKAGQTVVLKSGVNIISVVKEGSVEANSNCAEVQTAIDNAESMACFRIIFVGEHDEGGGSGPFRWDDGQMRIMGIGIRDQFYGMDNYQLSTGMGNTERSQAFVNKVSSAMGTNNSLIRPVSMLITGNVGERDEFTFIFYAPDSLGTTVWLGLMTPGDTNLAYARFYGEKCASCCPSS